MAKYVKKQDEDSAAAADGNLETATERSAWDHVLLARHPQRPHSLDYISRMIDGFSEIHGDRVFGDDPAIVCGFGSFRGQQVMAIGQQKGRKTEERVHRNFGMPRPEGYRKALRCMKLAEKFGRPILTLLDTPGAYPGKDAEERGQAEAIARNLYEMANLTVPLIAACIGEGGSGGALALGVGNRVLMMENAVYSVISPESCAAIVWRDSGKAELAASALKMTAVDLKDLGLVDEIVSEPKNGAHEDLDQAAALLGDALERNFELLAGHSADELVEGRYEKFRSMGSFFEDVQ
jgi:acetyl-CoA carboxylase carboxyl transferase subunit alpha